MAAIQGVQGKKIRHRSFVAERADDKKRNKNPNGPQPDDECRKCGGLGHWYFHINQGLIVANAAAGGLVAALSLVQEAEVEDVTRATIKEDIGGLVQVLAEADRSHQAEVTEDVEGIRFVTKGMSLEVRRERERDQEKEREQDHQVEL